MSSVFAVIMGLYTCRAWEKKKKKAACLSLSLQSAGSNISVLQPLKPSLSLFDDIAQMKLRFVVAQGLKRLACVCSLKTGMNQVCKQRESCLCPSQCYVLWMWTAIRFDNQPVNVLLWLRVTHWCLNCVSCFVHIYWKMIIFHWLRLIDHIWATGFLSYFICVYIL